MKAVKDFFNLRPNFFKDTEKPIFFDWALLIAISFFMFITFLFWDLSVTGTHTINYMDAIAHGDILGLYKVNMSVIVDGSLTSVCYDFFIFIFFMIWNIPVWIIKHLFDINVMENFYCLLWMKGMLVFFLVLSSVIIKKICEQIGINRANSKWAMFIFLSSPLVFSSIFILCQYDIISITLMLLGILAYIKNQNYRFIFWFALAIPLKLFPLFVFIPLLLLKEKRVFFILFKLCNSLYLYFACRIIESFMPYHLESTEMFDAQMINKLFQSGITVNLSTASLFAAIYIIICAFCYVKNINDQDELNKYSIYIPFIVYLTFILIVDYHPQWLIFLTVFFPIILFMNSKHYKANILLDMALSATSLYIISYHFTRCFNEELLNKMFFSKLLPPNLISNSFIYVRDLISFMKLDNYFSCIHGIFMGLVICLVVLNFPKFNNVKKEVKVERSIITSRLLLIVPLIILIIITYLY